MKRSIILSIIIPFCTGVSAHARDASWSGGDGNWSDATHWNTNPLFPNNGNGGFNYDVIHFTPATITLDQDISIRSLTLSGGVIAGEFDLDVKSSFSWVLGEMAGTGATNLNAGFSSSISGSELKFLSRVLNNNVTTTFSSGDLTTPLSFSYLGITLAY